MSNIREVQKNEEGEKKKLQKELREKILSYVTAALGLVAGLAWNDAVRSLIEFIFPAKANNLIAKFVYAFVFTVIVVVATIYLGKLLRRNE